jgi:hypothetical protein
MRDSIEIQGVGEVFLTKPRSFAAISDLNVDWWAAQQERGLVGRPAGWHPLQA